MSQPLIPPGPDWCAQFPGSIQTTDLQEPFQSGVVGFLSSLRTAGAAVKISATYRPPERAYLMHWCCLIAGYRDAQKIFHQISASDVPPMDGVDIDWTCKGDAGAARAAAAAMRQRYEIVVPAALISRHTQRRAIDMTISWPGAITVLSKKGRLYPVSEQMDLVPIGATYGVMKLVSDPPHWSDDGR